MRSATMPDQGSAAGDPVVNDLLVLWQHPISRSIIPIGRLTHHANAYAFSYTRAAKDIEGFRPLPGLRDLYKSHRSTRLPAVFEQRVMHPERPDYSTYLESIGLEPSQATPWEQIVHSRGLRAGDTLQFMQTPEVQRGRAKARFFANGVRHIPSKERILDGRAVHVTPAQHEEALRRLRQGMQVDVEAEDGNAKDPNAALITAAGVPLGYVPWCLSRSVRELSATGRLRLTVARIAPSWVPTHVRLVLDLNVPAPLGFKFDREGQWEPLPTAQ
ncbi:hypothetical protein GTW20_13390 [Nocardiopsis alba]|uniref:HIRAN domain-containing protein n=1 Tax=Nocardiopsis alba TaxID=53437 RepID=A0A7K2ITE9_9ACTN|nr:hypothetical protein [Nocardiopsis alba]MYR33231.1 hypothetical protein [Nocardiopsis alba]